MGEKTPLVLVRVKYYGEKTKNRDWYSSNTGASGGDYLAYVDSGSKAGRHYGDYMDYAGNPEKSSGAFGKGGLLSREEKAEIRERLKSTKSKIWDMVISLEEDYGKEHWKSWKDAQKVLNKVLPKFFEENDMPYGNMTWFAGMHENTDNRHVHVCFFENAPTKWKCRHSGKHWHKGKLKKETFQNLKVSVFQAIESSPVKAEEAKDFREGLSEAVRRLPMAKGGEEYKEALLQAYRAVKATDKQLSYLDPEADEARPYIDKAVDFILDYDEEVRAKYRKAQEAYARRDLATKRYCEREGIDPRPYCSLPKFNKDIRRRLGNQILKLIQTAQEKKANGSDRMEEWKGKRWDEKKKRSYLFGHSMRTARDSGDGLLDFLDKALAMLQSYAVSMDGKPKRNEFELQ